MIFAATLFAFGSAVHTDRLRFDTRWWNQAPQDEQEGFILGYLSCREPHVAINISISDYRVYVDNIMATSTGTGPHPKYVIEAIAQYWLSSKPSTSQQGGESDSLNGLSWSDDSWNRGFVEGFLQCYSIAASKPIIDLYKGDVDRHYASSDRVNDPLADVMKKLLSKRKVPPRPNQ